DRNVTGVQTCALPICTDRPCAPELHFAPQGRSVPTFNADSAYQKLAAQVKIGPRNPGSIGHKKTQTYLVKQLQKYAGKNKVFAQEFTHAGYGGDTLQLANIIAAFNPTAADRI